MLIRRLQRIGQLGHVSGAVGVEAIKGTRPDQRLQHPTIGLAGVNTATEIEQILELTAPTPLFQNLVDRILAHALDGPQAVTDGAVIHGREAEFRAIDIGRQ